MEVELHLFNKYCIDSCSLIDLWRRIYPSTTFPTLWEKIEKKIEIGEIISSIEVYNELVLQRDTLSEWVKQHKGMFVGIDKEQVEIASIIYNKYPDMVTRSTRTDADGFIVALAKSKNITVVTSENRRTTPSPTKPKVPNLCDEFNVRCINLLEFFEEMGWRF